ncbi:MAG: pyruvate kinase [Patescibacteria group bacterium]|nr:pyruvate kinase [Patescibacteria group bacterium]
MKKTKIVATIGPSSESQTVLRAMAQAGMNVCRLNFSHGDYKWHKRTIKRIRAVEKQTRKKIGIMADIQGARVRVANRSQLTVSKGEVIFLTDGRSTHNQSHEKDLVLNWKGFHEFLKRGDRVYIEDGIIQLEIVKRVRGGCSARVLVDGKLKPHKGVNIPSISKYLGFLTSKDLDDLQFILSQNVDFIAASFVSRKEDLKNLKRVIQHFYEREKKDRRAKKDRQQRNMPWIISKIERRKALKNIKEIIKESDAIMVARGDLAIEMPQEKVAIYQKDIVQKCIKAKKPVIVATQMMASMINNARPTRAEISDVTNAVIDNADSIMLSNETAVGAYPVKVVEAMAKIIKSTEDSPYNDVKLKKYGRLAKLLFLAKKRKTKIFKAKDLEETVRVSSLRQEDVKITLTSKKPELKRKAALVWGVD